MEENEFPCENCLVKMLCNPREERYPTWNIDPNREQIINCVMFLTWSAKDLEKLLRKYAV